MNRLEGKTAIVTGAAGGQGAAEAALFAAEGARVLLTDIAEDQLHEVVARIVETGGDAIGVRHDVSNEEDWKDVVSLALEKFGKIDVLVNNAGIGSWANILEETSETYDKVLTVDLKSQFLGMKWAGKAMADAGNGGAIVNIGSVFGLRGWAGFAAYSAAKGGVAAQSRAAATDLAPYGIRVNCVFPGTIATNMTAPVINDPVLSKAFLEAIPLRRFGVPSDIAYAALYLVSDEASFVTGAELVVDGGRIMY